MEGVKSNPPYGHETGSERSSLNNIIIHMRIMYISRRRRRRGSLLNLR